MLPSPIPRSGPISNDSDPLRLPDLTHILEQHVQAGFPPDLALDLVLNELVVRAADATHATAAALALARGDEMVCRAATGPHALDLGIPINTRDGLSGACVRTGSPQLCNDAESDPRVDPVASRHLGIRSMLIVPVFEPVSNQAADDSVHTGLNNRGWREPPHADLCVDELLNDASPDLCSGEEQIDEWSSGQNVGQRVYLRSHDLHRHDNVSEIRTHQLAGVLEVFSPLPNAFSQSAETVLEDFARECARICRVAAQMRTRPLAEIIPPADESTPADPDFVPAASIVNDSPPAPERRAHSYESWTFVLAALVILAAATLSFLIGSRVGWLRSPQPASIAPASTTPLAKPGPANSSPPAAVNSAPARQMGGPAHQKPAPPIPSHSTRERPDNSNELVIYEKGKIIFRMPTSHDSARDPSATQGGTPRNSNSETALPSTVWLAPDEAESLLVNRVEPQYPADAIAAHRSGNVTLEVHVAEDGSVSSVQTLSGDPLLATAAAQAVLNWRYQPYRSHEQPSPFQTDVTLTFSLPN
ncbi:MAG: TonB family protein [Terriglobales bacterium]